MRVMMAHNSSRQQITPGPRFPPYPKNIFIADLHESHKRPIFSKRRISPKGDKFASLNRSYIVLLELVSDAHSYWMV